MWVWIAVVAIALIVLVSVAVRLFGRLSGLERAARRLLHRQEDALRIQAGAETLQQTVQDLQRSAEVTQDKVARIQAARGH
jgi:uncharacterized protein YlxW (UPF0749 family)